MRPLVPAAVAVMVLMLPLAAQALPRWCHRAVPGDTLARLAVRYDTTIGTLRRLNGWRATPALRGGEILALPAVQRLRRGRLLPATPPLLASPGNLRAENRLADREQLSRLTSARMRRRFVRAGLLVPVPARTHTYRVEGVPARLRVARPWTRRFVEQLAAAYHAIFGERLKVTSLTRTVPVQRALGARNGNAAPSVGRERSTHLTGAAVDLSKQPLGTREVAWLRHVLRRLDRRGVVSAIEELRQAHFHVLVSKRYLGYARRLRSPLLIGGC